MNALYPRHIGPDVGHLIWRQLNALGNSPGGVGGGGGGTVTITHPFQITDISDPEADPLVPRIDVRYGTVMDIVPTGVNAGTSGFTDLTDDATNVLYLAATLDIDGFITAVELDAAASQPADDDYTAHITIGSVIIASGVITTINQAATHSLRFATCGRVVDGETLTTRGTYEFRGF